MAERYYSRVALTPDAPFLTLDGEQAHHLTRVRRVLVGEQVDVFDGLGKARTAEVVEVEKTRVTLRPIGAPLPDRRPAFDLTLATAVPKGERFDWLVEKASELGVDRLIPLRTERSVVDPGLAKLERLRKTCVESAKQCGRNRLLQIAAPMAWPDALASFGDFPNRWMAHPNGLPCAQWPRAAVGTRGVVAIGPEGGWTPTELDAACAAGWHPIGLGPMILRVETAALAATSRLLAATEPNS